MIDGRMVDGMGARAGGAAYGAGAAGMTPGERWAAYKRDYRAVCDKHRSVMALIKQGAFANDAAFRRAQIGIGDGLETDFAHDLAGAVIVELGRYWDNWRGRHGIGEAT